MPGRLLNTAGDARVRRRHVKAEREHRRERAGVIALPFGNRRTRARVGLSLTALVLVTMLSSSSPVSASGTASQPAATNVLNIVADPVGPFSHGFNPFSTSNS